MFEHKPEIKLISRISKKGPIPILFECLPINATSQNDFIVWNKIDLNLEKQGFKNDISLPFYNEMVKRIRNFYSLFGKMNKDFLLNAISYEKVFIKDCPYSMNFDKKSAITQLELIEKELHKGKIIVQIGKNINYIAKTTGHAYDRTFYVNNFYQFFNPGMDPKIKGAKVATPNKINSMNLVSNSMSEMYEMVPGFMEIEW